MVCLPVGCAAMVALLLAPGGMASAQDERAADEGQRAWRFARELEIADRRPEAAAELLALGEAAVGPLLGQARHPDLGVARAALEVIAALGPEGLSAVPELEQRANGDDAHAVASAWALARLPRHGTFFVACLQARQVVEIDGGGDIVWRSPELGRAWSVEELASGNLLLAEVDGKVAEYDRDGNLAWEYSDCQRPYDAQRLIDGNTLIADFGKREVIEIDVKGEVVWRFGDVTPIGARRLPGGTTLITDYDGKRIVEVDRAGKIVRELPDIGHSYGGERLRDGSTLVIQSTGQRLQRFDPRGEKVLDLELPQQPSHALLVPGGWVVAGQGFILRMREDGTAVWNTKLEGWCGRICPR